MATSFYFNNRKISLPGAYSTIISGESNVVRDLDYGKCLIIDTGIFGAGYGGGSGIAGEHASDKNAIYSFTDLESFRAFVKGGMYWKIAQALFQPDPNNAAATGISELYFVRAAETKAATMTFATAAAGSFIFKTIDEGLNANGVKDGDILSKGYGYTVQAGVEDPTKYMMKFWLGSYTGLASDNISYNELTKAESDPQLILQSIEFSTITELIAWAEASSEFNARFIVDETSAGLAGAIVSGDIPAGVVLATGGTETYLTATTHVDRILENISDLDYSVVFTDQFGDNGDSVLNGAILTHLNQASKYGRHLFVGGYDEKVDYQKSLDLSIGFDSEKVVVVHGASGMASATAALGYRWWGVMYSVASMVGRTYGKPTYIPVTNKSIGVDKVKHLLSEKEQEKALKYGVSTIIYSNSLRKFVILQGVTTLQDNQNLFNLKGQSFSLQFMRIVFQLNKELQINSAIDLLGDENGVTANSLSANKIVNWTKTFLQTRVANETTDNLLLQFKDVIATRNGDAWFVSYKIQVNNEITKLFFTGYLIK